MNVFHHHFDKITVDIGSIVWHLTYFMPLKRYIKAYKISREWTDECEKRMPRQHTDISELSLSPITASFWIMPRELHLVDVSLFMEFDIGVQQRWQIWQCADHLQNDYKYAVEIKENTLT
jgi:hypothetical protein